jgi:signal transduction histidine kinase
VSASPRFERDASAGTVDGWRPESTPSMDEHVGRSFTLSRRIVVTLIAICWLTTWVGLYPFDIWLLTALSAAWVATHFALEWLFPRTRNRGAFLAVDAFAKHLHITVGIHLLGGPQATAIPLMYVVPIAYNAVTLSRLQIFLTANVGAALYATLMVLEARGVLAHHAVFGVGPPTTLAYVQAAVAAAILLNVAAAVCDAVARTFARTAAEVEAANAALAEKNEALQTKRHELEAKVEERTRLLAAANRSLAEKARALESRQEDLKAFIYAVTHDLKSPLTNILLSADLIRGRDAARLAEDSREDLARVMRLAEGGEAMIQDLLALFQITSAPESASSVNLEGLVAQALDGLRSEIDAKNLRVRVGPLPRVWGDAGKLRHVLANLLGNAVKYVSAGEGEVEVTGRTDDGGVVLCVRDNGIGIPPDFQKNVFEVFRRVPGAGRTVDGRVVDGTGVGLAIVKRIVEAHGGTVWVESAPGAGSRFFVRLPAGPER